jgi:hypothetical protein
MFMNLRYGESESRPIRPGFAAQPSLDPPKVKVFEAETDAIPAD